MDDNKSIQLNKTYEQIEPYIKEFYDDIHGADPKKSRYLSWEHCFIEFQNARSKVINNPLYDTHNTGENISHILTSDEVDNLALHLGFYLASWGMMRGSSFLLNMDYKIHTEVVRLLLEDYSYNYLWELNDNIIKGNNIDTDKVYNLYKDLSNQMAENIYGVNNKALTSVNDNDKELGSLTPTLFSKILMGTIGCTLAYDRFLISAFKNFKFTTTIKSIGIQELIDFYSANKSCIDKLIIEFEKTSNVKYPVMKIIDMAFWDYGYKCSCIEQYLNTLLEKTNTIPNDKPVIDNLYIGRPESHYNFRLKMNKGSITSLNAEITEALREISDLTIEKAKVGKRDCLKCRGIFTNKKLTTAKEFKEAKK